jgi:hypothetical protein
MHCSQLGQYLRHFNQPVSSYYQYFINGRGYPNPPKETPMKSLSTTKDIHQGAKWELRLRLTDETKKFYQHLKDSIQVQQGKVYSDPKFFQVLMNEVSTILRLTK